MRTGSAYSQVSPLTLASAGLVGSALEAAGIDDPVVVLVAKDGVLPSCVKALLFMRAAAAPGNFDVFLRNTTLITMSHAVRSACIGGDGVLDERTRGMMSPRSSRSWTRTSRATRARSTGCCRSAR